MFMTAVCVAFLMVSKNSFALSNMAAVIVFLLSGVLFAFWCKKYCRPSTDND